MDCLDMKPNSLVFMPWVDLGKSLIFFARPVSLNTMLERQVHANYAYVWEVRLFAASGLLLVVAEALFFCEEVACPPFPVRASWPPTTPARFPGKRLEDAPPP